MYLELVLLVDYVLARIDIQRIFRHMGIDPLCNTVSLLHSIVRTSSVLWKHFF